MDPELKRLSKRMSQLISGERRPRVVRSDDPNRISVHIESDEEPTMKKPSTSSYSRYVLTVGFVDSTYWDDGSRYTSRSFEYSDKIAMESRKAELMGERVVKFKSAVSGEESTARVDWLRVETTMTTSELYDL